MRGVSPARSLRSAALTVPRSASNLASVASSTGFTRCASKPASRDAFRSESCPHPVSATSTGHRASPSRWRIRRATSNPLSFGSPMSSRITLRAGKRLPRSRLRDCRMPRPIHDHRDAEARRASPRNRDCHRPRGCGAEAIVVTSPRCSFAGVRRGSIRGSRTKNSLPRPTPSLRTSTVPPCIPTRVRPGSGLCPGHRRPAPAKCRSA